MREIHIAAAFLALITGFIALYAPKGGPVHRRGGMYFVLFMLIMTVAAEFSAQFLKVDRVNQVAAALAFYLVCTSALTVRTRVDEVRGLLAGLALLALVVGLRAFSLGAEAVSSPSGLPEHIPAPPLFLFGTVGVAGAALDARLLMVGRIEGKHRLTRHLWRMGFALWMATASFFLGQAKFIPPPVRKTAYLVFPVLLVMLTVAYWLVRTLKARRPPKSAAAS